MTKTTKKTEKNVTSKTKSFEDKKWWKNNIELCAKMVYIGAYFEGKTTMSLSEYPNELKLYIKNLKQFSYALNKFINELIACSDNPNEDQIILEKMSNRVADIVFNAY